MNAPPAQIGLAGFCSLLLIGVLYELAAPPPTFTLPDAVRPVSAAPLPPAAVFVPPTSALYMAINARPIFSPSRTPVEPKPTGPAAAPPPPPTASLVGVIIDARSKLALIKTPASPLETSVEVGGAVGGWQLTQILPDRIVLQLGAATDEIKLEFNRAKDEPTAKAAGLGPAQLPREPTEEQKRQGDGSPSLVGTTAQGTVKSPASDPDKHN